MRKTYFAALAAATFAGSSPTAPAAAPFGAPTVEPAAISVVNLQQPAPAAPQSSWKERLLKPFKLNPFAANPTAQQTAAPQAAMPADPPIDPKTATPELFIGLAQMSHRAGNVTQARQYYQQALALSPNHLEALLGAARMEDREGQLDVAQMLYQRAVAASPRNATALNDLGLCLARRGDLQGARQVLQQAVQVEPTKPLYRNNIAKVLVELNQQNEALTQLSAVHPPAAAHYNLGVLLSQRGRDREAIQCFQQANKLDPSFEPARVAVMQRTGSAVMPPAVDRSIANGQNPIAQMIDNNSILPTPQSLATVPWKSPQSYEAAIQPSAQLQSAGEAPATAATPAESTPALLPPVN
jgi:Flp pilus assembly protein TadD